MRLTLLGLVVALGVTAVASEARAQVPFTGVNDPFFAYYSFYLPRQQAQALSPGPEATINAINANRQQYAATNRSDMFDPRGAALDSFLEGSDGGALNSGLTRRTISQGVTNSRIGGNLAGTGPKGYYNSANRYHPGLRAGRGKNADIAGHRNSGFRGGGMGGMGGGLGLPGPR
ncbi:hypothetical protein P12x_003315 [Tundrisphaera lichenicola]|uniref:hypothetical protein n=1 Tax=Tundrisphaera lichenicola TaxID=2029860 RepID=UPI003EB6E287